MAQATSTADSTHPTLHVGDHVRDRETADPPLVVVGLPDDHAATWTVDDAGTTVADCNREYPTDDPVVEAVYATRTTGDLTDLDRYAFPRSRLERVGGLHSVEGVR